MENKIGEAVLQVVNRAGKDLDAERKRQESRRAEVFNHLVRSFMPNLPVFEGDSITIEAGIILHLWPEYPGLKDTMCLRVNSGDVIQDMEDLVMAIHRIRTQQWRRENWPRLNGLERPGDLSVYGNRPKGSKVTGGSKE